VVQFRLTPAVRAVTNDTFRCIEEQGCDEEEYNLCAKKDGDVDFLACMDAASSGSAQDKAKTCATSTSLSWESISSCFSGSEGKDLLAATSKDLQSRFPSGLRVPHIEVQGKEVTDRSYSGLLNAVCATGIKAAACSGLLIV